MKDSIILLAFILLLTIETDGNKLALKRKQGSRGRCQRMQENRRCVDNSKLWHYDIRVSECRHANEYECGGKGNRFRSKEYCERICSGHLNISARSFVVNPCCQKDKCCHTPTPTPPPRDCCTSKPCCHSHKTCCGGCCSTPTPDCCKSKSCCHSDKTCCGGCCSTPPPDCCTSKSCCHSDKTCCGCCHNCTTPATPAPSWISQQDSGKSSEYEENPTRVACNPLICKSNCAFGCYSNSTDCKTYTCLPASRMLHRGVQPRQLGQYCSNIRATCRLHCPQGYAKDRNGCDICECNQNGQISTGCSLDRSCTVFCEHGFQRGPDGCEICLCRHSSNSDTEKR